MTKTYIKNAMVWDGISENRFAATVVVDGNKIAQIIKNGEAVIENPSNAIDGSGMTLMPGMVEGHCHPSFVGITNSYELGLIPPERHMLLTAANLKLLLAHGFTSIFEAASAKPLLGVIIFGFSVCLNHIHHFHHCSTVI